MKRDFRVNAPQLRGHLPDVKVAGCGLIAPQKIWLGEKRILFVRDRASSGGMRRPGPSRTGLSGRGNSSGCRQGPSRPPLAVFVQHILEDFIAFARVKIQVDVGRVICGRC